MINFDDYTNENIIEHNSKWPYIPDHPYTISRTLIKYIYMQRIHIKKI